jgi:hypothetical protein
MGHPAGRARAQVALSGLDRLVPQAERICSRRAPPSGLGMPQVPDASITALARTCAWDGRAQSLELALAIGDVS